MPNKFQTLMEGVAVLLLLTLSSGCFSQSPSTTTTAPTGQPAATVSKASQAVQANNQGVAKVQQQDYSGALKDFNQAIQLDPKMPEAYLGRGIAHSLLGRSSEAIADFTTALSFRPQYAEAYLYRAEDHQQLGDRDQAIADLKQAAQLFQQQANPAKAELAQNRLASLQNPTVAPEAANPEPELAVATTTEATPTLSNPEPAPPEVAPTTPGSSELALAQHLTQTGAKMYGTFWCPYCQRQEALFGEGVSQLQIIECDPRGENPQPEVCDRAGVNSYPTWEIKGQTHRGMLSLDTLADLSGYQGPRNFGL